MASNDLTVDRLFVNSDGIASRLNVGNLGFVETGQNDTLYIWPSSTSFITTKIPLDHSSYYFPTGRQVLKDIWDLSGDSL